MPETLPVDLEFSLKLYVDRGIHPGGFLQACLENDLVGAVNKASETNRSYLDAIVDWMYWEIPATCWGSKEKVKQWLDNPTHPEHDCEMLSTCCSVGPAEGTELDEALDMTVIGFCGSCHDHADFECEDESCEIQNHAESVRISRLGGPFVSI